MIGLYNPSKNNNATYIWLDGTAFDYQDFGTVSGTYAPTNNGPDSVSGIMQSINDSTYGPYNGQWMIFSTYITGLIGICQVNISAI
uniref:Uncharacterized protein n=1 Tax=Acrobeloides nanus TaxID=290746 RepID=A0A914EA35_9BILA